MSPVWNGPVVEDIPPTLPETTGVPYRLFRHYRPRARGINVYILTDGTVTQEHPSETSPITTFGPPFPPGYVTVTQVGVRLTLFGGHVDQEISEADATILEAAGYGANITSGTWGTYAGFTWASIATEQWGGL